MLVPKSARAIILKYLNFYKKETLARQPRIQYPNIKRVLPKAPISQPPMKFSLRLNNKFKNQSQPIITNQKSIFSAESTFFKTKNTSQIHAKKRSSLTRSRSRSKSKSRSRSRSNKSKSRSHSKTSFMNSTKDNRVPTNLRINPTSKKDRIRSIL